jgi:putative toxin-antitoxin system antitoxin component (TIGR02293 family)
MEHATEQRPSQGATDWGPALQSLIAGEAASYWVFYSFGLVERIGMVKAGLPAKLLTTLANDMHVPRERLYGWLGIARTTANRKVKDDEVLSQDESERALGITSLVGQVQKIVSESGSPDGFDAARWTADWLEEQNDALGGRTPGEFMDTSDGRALVSGLVAQMQSGAYA